MKLEKLKFWKKKKKEYPLLFYKLFDIDVLIRVLEEERPFSNKNRVTFEKIYLELKKINK